MATFNELAQEYARRLAKAQDKRFEAQLIASAIDRLVYTSSERPLSYEDKKSIVEKIFTTLKEEAGTFKEFSNQEYLNLVNYILSQIGSGKK